MEEHFVGQQFLDRDWVRGTMERICWKKTMCADTNLLDSAEFFHCVHEMTTLLKVDFKDVPNDLQKVVLLEIIPRQNEKSGIDV